MFDARGDGYGRGEGFAVLVLKKLTRAIQDGNPIRALIRSVGMNQDGYTISGITQPSKKMQVKLIRQTHEKAGLDTCNTRFFEAQGTVTPVGDPISDTARATTLFLCKLKPYKYHQQLRANVPRGAVKSNIGILRAQVVLPEL